MNGAQENSNNSWIKTNIDFRAAYSFSKWRIRRNFSKRIVNKCVKTCYLLKSNAQYVFGSPKGRKSMRDLMLGIEADKSKYCFWQNIIAKNLGPAKENVAIKIYKEFAYLLI